MPSFGDLNGIPHSSKVLGAASYCHVASLGHCQQSHHCQPLCQGAGFVRRTKCEFGPMISGCYHRIDAHQFFDRFVLCGGSISFSTEHILGFRRLRREGNQCVSPAHEAPSWSRELCPPGGRRACTPPLLKQVGRMIGNEDNEIDIFFLAAQ